MEVAFNKQPQYTFGIKHRYRGSDNTPASNYYTVTGRSKIGSFHEDLQKTPGPGNYSIVTPDIYRNKQPLYSMLGRNGMPGDSTRKPGPGSHSPEKVYITKRKAPECSFGIRHSTYVAPLIVEVKD